MVIRQPGCGGVQGVVSGVRVSVQDQVAMTRLMAMLVLELTMFRAVVVRRGGMMVPPKHGVRSHRHRCDGEELGSALLSLSTHRTAPT